MKNIEKRDLYDINRVLTGKTIFKGDSIPDNNYIVVVLVFIQNSDGKFLIQKRSKIKSSHFSLIMSIRKTFLRHFPRHVIEVVWYIKIHFFVRKKYIFRQAEDYIPRELSTMFKNRDVISGTPYHKKTN